MVTSLNDVSCHRFYWIRNWVKLVLVETGIEFRKKGGMKREELKERDATGATPLGLRPHSAGRTGEKRRD